ncbi:MAG: peptide-methionine (R)-S-oxide reductase MsrB [Mariprofundaceae bacterium]
MNRRTFIVGLLGTSMAALLTPKLPFARNGKGSEMIEKIHKTDEEWRRILTPEQYHVLRQEGTERPFTSPLNEEKRKGVYACAGCGLELFSSESKFDSGTGWPSFFTAMEAHVETKRDFRLILPRTEYHCARCQGHQGHIFNDGPKPSGQRWCNNGVALRFVVE